MLAPLPRWVDSLCSAGSIERQSLRDLNSATNESCLPVPVQILIFSTLSMQLADSSSLLPVCVSVSPPTPLLPVPMPPLGILGSVCVWVSIASLAKAPKFWPPTELSGAGESCWLGAPLGLGAEGGSGEARESTESGHGNPTAQRAQPMCYCQGVSRRSTEPK